MPSVTDSSRPCRRFGAAAMLGVLAVLVLAAGWALSADAPPEGATVASAAVVAAGHTTATADAYRRSDVSRWPQQLPAAPAVVGALVVIGLAHHRRPTPRA